MRCDLLLSSVHTSRVIAGTDTTSAAADAFAATLAEEPVTSRLGCLPPQSLPSLVFTSQLLLEKSLTFCVLCHPLKFSNFQVTQGQGPQTGSRS